MALNKLGRFVLSTGLIGGLGFTAAVGSADAATPNLFASVHMNGTLMNGGGVATVAKLGTGRYEVTFTSDVQGCAYAATTLYTYTEGLGIFTAGGHSSPNGVYVETKNQGGGLTDGGFNLHVNCGNPGTKFAVVGYTSNLVRSTAGTTLTDLGGGRYNVVFSTSVASCAYLATVADPANGLVYSPAGVYTGTGPGTNTVYIETKNPGGGLTTGIPFHLSVVCTATANAKVAAVKADGMAVRGSGLTSTFRPTTGSYTMVTNRDITKCAVLGTRGSVDRSVPYTPAIVDILGWGGKATNVAYFQVKHLLFFGNGITDQAIHTAIVC